MKSKQRKFILFLILFISIGFATLTAYLRIKGYAYFKGGEMNVYFDNIVIDSNSTAVGNAEINNDGDVDFYATIEENEFVFSVDIKNEGDFNSLIDGFTIKTYNSDDEEIDLPEYVDINIEYSDGKDGSELRILNINSSLTLNVSVSLTDGIIIDNDENLSFVLSADVSAISSSLVEDKNTCISNIKLTAGDNTLCKRATTLHVRKCDSNCSYFHPDDADAVFLGSCGKIGELSTGDAFTCDVNGDGVFDEEKERFYLVGNYFDTFDFSYLSNVAVLIYSDFYDYETVNYSLNSFEDGPTSAMNVLPSKDNWSNTNLYNDGVRNILSINNDIMKESFDYADRAARLLTYQEAVEYCHIDDFNKYHKDCEFLFEGTSYFGANSSYYNYWLETLNNSSSGYGLSIWGQGSCSGIINVKPVIDVPMNRIVY